MNSRLRTLTSFLIVIGAIILFHYFGWLRPIERLIGSVVNPLSFTVYEWSIVDADGNVQLRDANQLYESYQQLQIRYQEAIVDKANLLRAEEENAILREQLNFSERTDFVLVGSRVIGKNTDPLGSTLLINKGRNDGVEVGQPVIVGDGILVGLIHAVDDTGATVLLIDDSQSKIAATILGETRSIGLLEGGFGLSIRMSFIPQNEEIAVGDLIVTSGLTDGIPDGLVIGTVEAVEREAYQPFQTAVVAPAVDLNRIVLTSVILE